MTTNSLITVGSLSVLGEKLLEIDPGPPGGTPIEDGGAVPGEAEGDPIKVGEFEGRVVTIEPRALVVQTGDKTLRIKLGTVLRDGKELDGGDDTASAVEAESKEI